MRIPITITIYLTTQVFLLALVQTQAAITNSISLEKVAETATTVSFGLQAQSITKPIIGISTTIQLPQTLRYQSFEKGTFFEKTSKNTTYLIGPKKTDGQEIIVGIASLEQPSLPNQNGELIRIICSKQGTDVSPPKLTDSIASGIENNQRQDYPQIVWVSTPRHLTNSGSHTTVAIILGLLLTTSYQGYRHYRKLENRSCNDGKKKVTKAQ